MPRVVGTVATTPCCVMGITAPVTSWVRAPCVGSLALTGRRGVGDRALEGSGETELMLEAKGVGRGGVCVRAPEGVGRDGTRARGQGVGRATIWARDREDRCAGARVLAFCGWLSSSFAFFIALIWVSLFMVPNSSPRAFQGVSSPLQRFFFFEGLFFVDSEFFLYFLRRVRASAPAGCSPRAFWRNGVIPSKAFTPE